MVLSKWIISPLTSYNLLPWTLQQLFDVSWGWNTNYPRSLIRDYFHKPMKSLKNPMNPSVIAWGAFIYHPQFLFPLWRSPQNLRWAGHFSEDFCRRSFLVVASFFFWGRRPSNFFCGSSPCLGSQKIYLLLFRAGTLSPIIMEVEHYPRWKETHIEVGPIFHFHDYGRKGTCTVTQEIVIIYIALAHHFLRQNPRKKQSYWWTHGWLCVCNMPENWIFFVNIPDNVGLKILFYSLSDAHPTSNNDKLNSKLVGGFNHFLFSLLFGEDSHFD